MTKFFEFTSNPKDFVEDEDILPNFPDEHEVGGEGAEGHGQGMNDHQRDEIPERIIYLKSRLNRPQCSEEAMTDSDGEEDLENDIPRVWSWSPHPARDRVKRNWNEVMSRGKLQYAVRQSQILSCEHLEVSFGILDFPGKF